MKTIFVVFSNTVLSSDQIVKSKKYCFNTDSDLKVGDMIKSNTYDSSLLVVRVLDKNFKYYNSSNGELSDEISSTLQNEIKTLVIREEESNVVYGRLVV